MIVDSLVQICVVAEDFEHTIGVLAEQLGVGPWKCWHYQPPAVFDTQFEGRPVDFTMKLGVAWAGSIQLEVIQPVEGLSMYRQFLDAHGEGPHHLLVGTATGYFAAIEKFKEAGFPVAQGARINPPLQLGGLALPPLPQFLANSMATQFVYHDTQAVLKTVLEISKMPPGISFRLGVRLGKPDFWLPPGSRGSSGLPNQLIEGITAVGILTGDLDLTRSGWERVGVSGWKTHERPVGVTARAALKPAVVELLQPGEAGFFREFLNQHGEGIRYLEVTPNGLTREQAVSRFESLGMPAAHEDETGIYLGPGPVAKTLLRLA